MPQNQPPTTTNPSMCNYTALATSARIGSGIWNTFLACWTTATRGANATIAINFIHTCGSKGTGRGLALVDVCDGKERKQNSYSIECFCFVRKKANMGQNCLLELYVHFLVSTGTWIPACSTSITSEKSFDVSAMWH